MAGRKSEYKGSRKPRAPLGPRSQGGCHTCKIRRVKCDERKPGCLRCEKFGRACDGYEIKRFCTPPGPRPSQRNQTRRLTTSAPIVHPNKQPIAIAFRDEQEARYFRTFIDETSPSLSGGFDTPLWNQIVLQACHDESCILQIAVALSALDKANKVKSNKALAHTSEAHHRYAIQEYSKALKGLQNVVSTRGHSLRTALIASLLIFCFENFHGDARLALVNVQRAVELMHNWLATSEVPFVPGSSPAPHTVDHDIVAAFARLELHVTSWIEAPPHRSNIPNYLAAPIEPLPPTFYSLLEAKKHFDQIANRVFIFLKRAQSPEHGLLKKPGARPKAMDMNYILSAAPEPAVAGELRDWLRAFDPFLKLTRTPEEDNDFVGATILRIHALLLKTSLESTTLMSTNTFSYDLFLPEYSEIVYLSGETVKHRSFVKSYVFDAGIVPVLLVVLAKCRDPEVRRDAIEVLKRAGKRREGVWDARMMAGIGEFLIWEDGRRGMRGRNGEDKGGIVKVHLPCLNVTLDLPAPKVEGRAQEMGDGMVREEKTHLLDWVEKYMNVREV